MEIVENRAVLIKTRSPEKYAIIPKSKVVAEHPGGGYTVAVFWGLDEMRVLRNLGVKDAPSPIKRNYDWPGRYEPMGHQIETAAFMTMHRRCFCFNEQGTGKTLSALWAADYLMNRGEVRRVLVICPLSTMQSVWVGDINNSIIHRSAIVAHHSDALRRIEMIQGNYEFVISNYEGIELIARAINNDGRFDLIICDECFVAGTPVHTPSGMQAIETLKAGDEVFTSVGAKRIRKVVRNSAHSLVRIRTADGQDITCTRDHPFFTDAGWVPAHALAGRRLVSVDGLRGMRDPFQYATQSVGVAPTTGYECGAELLEILRSEEVASAASWRELFLYDAVAAAWDAERCGAQRRVSGSDVSAYEGFGAQTKRSWWQRDGLDASGAACAEGIELALGVELPRSVGEEARRLSYKLQARLCQPKSHGRSGGGRGVAQHGVAQGAGSQKRKATIGSRVVSIADLEFDGPVDVFNLEVEDVPNYFVGGGVLVHNCNAYKNTQTDRWKALASIVHPQTYLWMMTGTPAAQSPVDAYGLAKLVNPNGVPRFQTAWRDKVMRKITKFKWAPQEDAKETVNEALQPAIRFTKAQCMDLPPVVTEVRNVAMTAQQLKYYKLIKEQMLAQLAGTTITAVNAGVVVNKLLQISAGAAYADDKDTIVFDSMPRLKALKEIIEGTNRKVLVFALFRSCIETIVEYLDKQGIVNAQIHGDVNQTKRGQIINDFQNSEEVRVLVMQPYATAHGITLTAADTVVFYGPLMSVEMYLQCIARSDRKGQTSDKVTVFHIQSSPVEIRLFKAMAAKVDDQALLVSMFESEMKI